MLRVVCELDMALPEGKLRPAGRKFKLDKLGMLQAQVSGRLSVRDRESTHPDNTAGAKSLPPAEHFHSLPSRGRPQ